MKNKKNKKAFLRSGAFLICLSLILGSFSISPTVEAKIKYETKAYDKKIDKEDDFNKGEFKNTKIKKSQDGFGIELNEDGSGEYISQIVAAPFGATHIGLHWKEGKLNKNMISAQIRTSSDGKNFGNWVDCYVELEEVRDDIKNEEIFSALVEVNGDNYVQAKFTFEKEKNASLNSFTFTFINSGEESKKIEKEVSFFKKSVAESQGVLKTSPGGQNLNVISREEWGADESYRLDRKGKEEWPRSYHGTRKIAIHHTAVAGSNGITDFEANKAAVRAIYYYHAVSQGWGDIGYNALVDGAGNVYEGRYGTHGVNPTRINPLPEQIMALDIEAGHTSGYNSGSFGVAAMGDFSNFAAPIEQIDGVKSTIAYVADSRGIDIQGKSDFRRYDGTWHYDLNNVIGHRDATETACPGNELYSQITSIKTTTDNYPGILSNLDNFSAEAGGASISGTTIGLDSISFGWDNFLGATSYQYVLEKVFGTAGVASDSEPWETAWLNPENQNTKTTNDSNINISGETLNIDSNYVFYVRALDEFGKPISNTKHVNFYRDNSMAVDLTNPTVEIISPAESSNITGIVLIKANGLDNVGIKNMELYIDGKKITTVIGGSLSYNWNTKKISSGAHNIIIKAYDLAGNLGEKSIVVYK